MNSKFDDVIETIKTIAQGDTKLTELVAIAEHWTAQGLENELPKLYQTWIEHSSSPLVHVAYFNCP